MLISESDALSNQLSVQYPAGLDSVFGVLQNRVYVTGELILAKTMDMKEQLSMQETLILISFDSLTTKRYQMEVQCMLETVSLC